MYRGKLTGTDRTEKGIFYHSRRPCKAVSVLYQALGSACSPVLQTPPVSRYWDASADLSLPYISPYYINRPCLSFSAILILLLPLPAIIPNKDVAVATVGVNRKEGAGQEKRGPAQSRLGSNNQTHRTRGSRYEKKRAQIITLTKEETQFQQS